MLPDIHIWIFDLDNTLYPPGTEFVALIEGRMTDFMVATTGLSRPEARALQKRYLSEHGTTLAGLMARHGVDPADFLDHVHDVSTDSLVPDPRLRAAILALPGRKLVFTNGHGAHADRVLAKLDIADLFEDVFHLEHAGLVPKPDPATFARMIGRHAVDVRAAAFFEDTEKNLAPAALLGMTTVLVRPDALTSTAPFVHHRTPTLPPFLEAAVSSSRNPK